MRTGILAAVMAVWAMGASADSDQTSGSLSMDLDGALQAALAGSPGLAAAAHDSAAGHARARQAAADLRFSLTAMAGYTRHQEPNIVLPIHQAGVFPPLDDDIYEGRIQLEAPLFDGGRRVARVRAATSAAEAGVARLDERRSQTIAAVASIFIEAGRADDRLELVRSHLTVLRERRHGVAAMRKEGRAAPADLALLEAALAAGMADSLDAESRRREIAWRLGALVGDAAPIQPRPSTGAGVGAGAPPPAAPTEVIELAPPAVREAEARRSEAQANYQVAARAFWPEVTAFATLLSRAGDDLDFTGEWSAGFALRMPLYAGGGIGAARRAAVAASAAAERRSAGARLELQAGLALARERWHAAVDRHERLSAAAAAKGEVVAAQRALHEAGRLTLADLLSQESELLELRLSTQAAVRAAQAALLDYHASTGTLTASRARAIVEGLS